MMMNEISVVVLAALAVGLVVQLWLAYRHIRHIRRHRGAVPAAFAGKIGLAAHQKAADYTVAKKQLAVVSALLGAVVLLLWTFGGGLEWLDGQWQRAGWGEIYTGTALIVSFMLVGMLIELPTALYATFVIEARFGFNKMSGGLFLADTLKGAGLAVVLGTPLVFAALWLMAQAGREWWLYVWALWMGFVLLMMWAWPRLIAPLFNQFEPLADAALRARIDALLARCGFSAKGVFVMDGSRRSGHGNAYFTGFGRNKRIVFYDTLLKSLSVDETEAVLAHELGHFKRHHIKKGVALMAVMSLAGLAVLGWLLDNAAFYQGLGVAVASDYMGLLLFMLVLPLFSFFISPLMSAWSRRHEFEADAYAKQQSDAECLVAALVKLYEDNASSLTPDPLHSAFYDSHPPAVARIARLQAG